jgi:hypothetical protein
MNFEKLLEDTSSMFVHCKTQEQRDFKSMALVAMKRVYNQAIDDAANNADLEVDNKYEDYPSYSVSRYSILKLKK